MRADGGKILGDLDSLNSERAFKKKFDSAWSSLGFDTYTYAGIDAAYAVRVYDESMKDKLQPDWVLQVDPFRSPKPGDFVVVQTSDGQAFIKSLVRRTQKAITVEQFNPPKTMEFKPDKVRVHLVVGIDLISR